MSIAKRKGRTRPEQSTTVLGAMRIDSALYEELRTEAAKSGRSITAQAETRLAQKPPSELARTIAIVVEAVENRALKSWTEDEGVQVQCFIAANVLMSLLFGESQIAAQVLEVINKRMDQLSGIAAGQAGKRSKPTAQEAAKARLELEAFLEGMSAADELASGIPD